MLHLLTAHHREDQAETCCCACARGSGLDGLAGMSAVRRAGRAAGCCGRCLAVPRARLAATARGASGQAWIEDPSNRDHRYARARLRQGMAPLAEAGLAVERLAGDGGAARPGAGGARNRGRGAAGAQRGALHPAGFAGLDAAALAAAPAEIGLRALRPRCCMRRRRRLSAARASGSSGCVAALARRRSARGRTLGGCRFVPRRGGVLVLPRAGGRGAAGRGARRATAVSWDGRFASALPAGGAARPYARRPSASAARRARELRTSAIGCRGSAPPVLRDDCGTDVAAVGSAARLLAGRRNGLPASAVPAAAAADRGGLYSCLSRTHLTVRLESVAGKIGRISIQASVSAFRGTSAR